MSASIHRSILVGLLVFASSVVSAGEMRMMTRFEIEESLRDPPQAGSFEERKARLGLLRHNCASSYGCQENPVRFCIEHGLPNCGAKDMARANTLKLGKVKSLDDTLFQNRAFDFVAAILQAPYSKLLGSAALLGENGEYALTARHVVTGLCDKRGHLKLKIGSSIRKSELPLVRFEGVPSGVQKAHSQESNVVDCKVVSIRGKKTDLAVLKLERGMFFAGDSFGFPGINYDFSRKIILASPSIILTSDVRLLAAGYGQNLLLQSGMRMWGEFSFDEGSCPNTSTGPKKCTEYEIGVNSRSIVNGRGFSGPCHGDSGSPLFALTNAGEFGLVGIDARVRTISSECDGGEKSAQGIFTNLLHEEVQKALKSVLEEMSGNKDRAELEKLFFINSNFDPRLFISQAF